MAEKAPIDYSEPELREAYRRRAETVQHSAKDYWEELLRRRQERTARISNRVALVIAIATAVNAGATVVLLLRALGVIAGE
jgi:hypothetical protein